MAASFYQIKNITAQSFCLSGLTINRMLASTVFKKTKGTGFAYNKALKTTPFGCSDAITRGGFAIMPHATAPLSLMLCAWSNMQKENGDTEIAFLAALALWLVTIGTGWLSKLVFEMWQDGSSIEFVSRKARILNHFPTSFIFFLSLVVLAIMAIYAAKQTLKFVTYLRN